MRRPPRARDGRSYDALQRVTDDQVLVFLAGGERTVAEVAERFGIERTSALQRLRILELTGSVARDRGMGPKPKSGPAPDIWWTR